MLHMPVSDTRFRKFLQARNPKIRITRKLLTKALTVRENVKSWHSSESIPLYPVSAESCGMEVEWVLIMAPRKIITYSRNVCG